MVMAAIMLTMIVGFLALSLDVGFHYYRGAQLQNAADAAATAVAGHLGAMDTDYEEVAYEYLAKNGFADKEKVHCKVEAKGETKMDTVDSDDYIHAGYYKISVEAEDNTFVGAVLGIDSLKLAKVAYAKADVNYVAMPRALNYTIFAASTEGTPANPAIQLNGKTGGVANSAVALTQNLMNGFNTWVVKPVQAFYIDIGTWWNPFTWKAGFDWDNANSWKAKLYTSNITTSGDVHSNSNIVSQIQAIHASRIQDTDFTNSVSAYDLAKFYNMTPIEDVTPTFEDYGQVTFDAVKEITFKTPSGINILGKDGPLDTYYYVQNQQFIEQTQLTLRILDSIDLNTLTNGNLQQKYEDAAELYLKDKITTNEQKDIIKNQVADGKITYDPSTKTFNISGQSNMVYSVNATMANQALDTIEQQGMDRMLFGTTEGVEGEYNLGVGIAGNDIMYTDEASKRPYYSMRNVNNSGDEYDNRQDFEQKVNFIKYDSEGEQTVTATAQIMGDNINRDYQDFNGNSRDKLSQLFSFTNAYTFNKTVLDRTKAGANFAIARTFIENSEYIDTPNLKPYFTRQINKSIRNATKIKEKINQSSAGQPTIRYAAKERTDTLKSYKDNLNYYDDTYKAADANVINLRKNNTQLFREFKDDSSSRVQNLSDTPITYNRTTHDGISYSVSISRYSYKGYNLYDGEALKSPETFYTEKLDEREETKADGSAAVAEYYNSTAKDDFNAVATKKAAIKDDENFKYSNYQNTVKNEINSVTKPNITTTAGVVTPEVTGVSLPTAANVFLGDGTSPDSKVTVGTNTLRTSYNSVLSSNAYPTYTTPTTVTSKPSGWNNNSEAGGQKGLTASISDIRVKNKDYCTNNMSTVWKNLSTSKGGVYTDDNITDGAVLQELNFDAKTIKVGKNCKNIQIKSINATKDANVFFDNKSTINVLYGASVTGGKNFEIGEECTVYVGSGVTCNSGGTFKIGKKSKVYVVGNVDVSYLDLGENAELYCTGTLQAGRKATIGSSAVLYSKGNMTFPNYTTSSNDSTIYNNGRIICDSILEIDKYLENYSGKTVIAKGGLIVDNANGDNYSIVNSGNIYVSADLNVVGTVYTTGGTIQVIGGIYAANSKGNDILHTNGACSVYVRGALTTTNSSNKNIWIDTGGAATVSVLGNGASTDVFNGKLNKFWCSAAGSNLYFGSHVKVNTGSEAFQNAGNMYVYGNLSIATSSSVDFINAYRTVIGGDLTANSASLVKVSGGHLLFTNGNINVSVLTADGSATKVHADGIIKVTGTLTLTNGALLEGIGGVTMGTDATSGGNFNSVKTIAFTGNISANSMAEGYVKTGNVNATSLTLNNVKLKIDGDLILTGNINLSNNSVLYVTGKITCADIILNNSKLYVDGDIICSSITETNNSLILARKGNAISSTSYSSITCSFKISATNSKLYCEGDLKATALDCNKSQVYGYRLFNTTANYSTSSSGSINTSGNGYFNITGNQSKVFCGEKSGITATTGISCEGEFFYPDTNSVLNIYYLDINGGKVIIDGKEKSQNVVVKNYAYIHTAGTYVNFGKTKVADCRFTTEGLMYFVGGVDVTDADTTDMRSGSTGSNQPDYFFFKKGSTSYVSPYEGSTKLSTLTLVSAYEAWGDVYLDAALTVKGSIGGYKWVLGTDTIGESGRSLDEGKDMYGNKVSVGHTGISIYIPKGITYVNGNITTYENNNKFNSVLIGEYGKYNSDSGLVGNGNINIAATVANSGKFEIRGAFNIDNGFKQFVTEKNDKDKYKEGKSIINGINDGVNDAVFFVGFYNASGNRLSGTSTTDLYGYVQNYGSMYFNNSASIKGFNNEVSEIAGGDCAFINYIGAQAHFGGFVRLNSNQLYNKWKNGSRECVFSCDGKLTFGGCLYNLGTVIAKGDITNNESNSETENNKNYRANNNYSVMNGMYKEFNDSELYNNFRNYVYPEATIYCGGKMEVGATEQGGESGSIFSAGTMYIVDDLNVYTNSSRLSIKSVGDVFNIFTNPNSHSFYRTAAYFYDNSNTFIGGDYFGGGAMAIGKDTIFMCGGDLRSKRAIKLGEEMGMVYYTVGPGISRYAFTFGHEDGSEVKYASGKGSTDSKYNSAYFYVGGNALVNTIGSGLKSWVGITGTTNVPLNNSRDMDIYPNTNMYIGGSLYANSKVYMKDNVDMVVAGNKTFYDSNGKILSTIYSSRFVNWGNFAPESLTNALNVENHLNGNKKLKFYVYQDFDMSPSSSMVVNGAMQVNETSKIRDMTKSYVYGSFTCGKYVELGKSLSGLDFSDIVTFDGSGEHVAKDSNNRYKYLTDEEIAYINAHGEKQFLANYEFDKSAYMFVDGDFTSGQDLGTGVLNFFDKIKKWLENTFLSTGYTKVYASSALKVNGNLSSSRYITLRHDAKVYCKGNMDAATSIEGGVYSEWYVGGHMEAATSAVTSIIDTIGGLFNITARGKIEMQDQSRVIVGGNMYSSASITLGVIPSGAYTRGRKTNYTVSAPEGSNSYYESSSDFEEALILTYENGGYKDKSGEPVYLDGKTYKYSNLKDSDNKNIEYGGKANVVVYNVDDGKYHKETYDGEEYNYNPGALADDDVSNQARTPDTNNGLDSTDEPNNYGAEVFVQGSMIAQNGFIKEFAYTAAVVGDYVYAPDYITLRSNADLWVLPETFNNETYEFLPYPDKPEDHGGFLSRLWNNITYYIGKFAYETGENFKFQTGSVYTWGSLTVNKNASLMGTNDLLQLGTITHADDSATSGVEKFLSDIGTFLTPRKVVLREDSLVLFGSNITIASSPASLSLDVLKGNESVAGFDSKGTAMYPGYQYKCKNHAIDGPHKGYNYTMTVDKDEHLAIQSGEETLTCDICHQPVDKNKFKIVQVSHPAVMYAGNSLYISTTVDMLMTYLIADQGDVYLHNIYTKTAYDKKNLVELPNAIGSYNGDITYTAWVGQLSSLFYAPKGKVDFDGIYTDIYGSVIGNTVEMNAYYQNFHRFNNWRTMDLHIAESGNVFLIPEQEYNEAPELGTFYDLTSGTQYQNSPYGVRIFF